MKTHSHTCASAYKELFAKFLSIGCVLIFASAIAFGQAAAQRDPQALAIISQTIAAAGGRELLSSIRDFTENGTVTYNLADPITGIVTVKSRGLHQFRIDADLSDGKRSFVTNGVGGACLKEADGSVRPISGQSAVDLGSLTLPYLPLIAAIQNSSTSITYVGTVSHHGAPAQDIRIQKTYTARQDPLGTRGPREARDFYIDPNTYLVVSISDRVHSSGREGSGTLHEVLYSNYRSEDGVMLPLTISETVRGVTGSTLQLSQVTFNSGLSDSDFTW